jgi:enterochelin esterase-like enzyme
MAAKWTWALLTATLVAASAGFVRGQESHAAEAQPQRAMLGVQLTDIACPGSRPQPDQTGVCVIGIRPNGAAARAGLLPGDVIVRVGEIQIDGPASVQSATKALQVGQTVEVGYRRDGENRLAHVVFDKTDVPGASPPEGMQLLMPGMSSDPCEDTRANALKLPPYPFGKQAQAMSRSEIEMLLGDRPAAVALKEDVLTLALRAPGGSARVIGSIQCTLDRVAGSTDLWALQLKWTQWPQTFLSAQFMATADVSNSPLSLGRPTLTAREDFRGKTAPPVPPIAASLRGTVSHSSLKSRFLGATKEISVYLPPERTAGPLPVLYLTDGQELLPFAALVEALISSGRIRPIAIVAEHAGQYTGDASKPFDPGLDDRAREYLPTVDPPRFELHMRFFVEELLPWAEQRFGLSAARADRAAMGYSNGGAFAGALGAQHPESFATVMPFSPASRLKDGRALQGDLTRLPAFLFAGGELESPFLTSARTDAEWLKSLGVKAELRTYWSGHDILQWQQALADYLPHVFPRSRR